MKKKTTEPKKSPEPKKLSLKALKKMNGGVAGRGGCINTEGHSKLGHD